MEFNEKFIMDTKIMRLMFVILLAPILIGCQQKQKMNEQSKQFIIQDTLLYSEYKETVNNCIYKYNMHHFLVPPSKDGEIEGQKKLDTALFVINKALTDFPNSPYFIEQKMYVLTEKKNFDEAIQVAFESNWTISEDSTYPHKIIVLNRLKAMKSLYLNNKEDADNHIRRNLQLLQIYLEQHDKEIDAHITSPKDNIALKGTYFLAVAQYYRYYTLVYGKEETYKQLDKIRNINKSLLVFIKVFIEEDFMKYTVG